MRELTSQDLTLTLGADGAVGLTSPAWPGFALDGLRPALRADGRQRALEGAAAGHLGDGCALELSAAFAGGLRLVLQLSPASPSGIALRAELHNRGSECELNDVVLLGAGEGAAMAFGTDPARQRLMEQGNYWGRTRRLAQSTSVASAQVEPDGAAPRVSGASDLVWTLFDAAARQSLVAGFLTSERWLGRVEVEAAADGRVTRWRLGFDGADVRLAAGSVTVLEEALLLLGPDPWRLLEAYGDAVAARHGVSGDGPVPVSWCSWYPYRLGVTEERLVETARIAARRLKPLGLSVVEVDLGWQAGNLPSTFDENERFPHGLAAAARSLEELGLQLGVWAAPYSISELDPLAREHPEYLIPGEDGQPADTGTWFWEPHGKIHLLDLTVPGAREWLRQRLASLAARGVRYFKPDFIGGAAHPLARRRRDRAVAAGGGTEAGRLGARIIREALAGGAVLNCGGPEMPGAGHLPLLYSCNDTGNTGFIASTFRQQNTQALACHLWKNRRWGIIQPSCLCVGLPGTLDEARLRATIAFLAGGQIDISDTLQTLPEDRWQVLTATLPPLGVSARPVDLFEPLRAVPFGYEHSTRGLGGPTEDWPDLPAGSVWHLPVETEWDRWDLVGLFAHAEDVDPAKPAVTRFAVPLERLGFAAEAPLEGYEFWSGQYLGRVPGGRRNAGGYTHPGDFQDLLAGDVPGALDVAFYGPAAKLICLRAPRRHPWVAGTTFHQSCGAELAVVTWDEAERLLSGTLRRPAGESGTITATATGHQLLGAAVDGRPVPVRRGAGDALVLPLTTDREVTAWSLRFR
ncbi:MAG: alpha-galactosidase [Gemmatimonadota bacterium]